MRQRRRGFTLVELMAVVMILTLLAVFVVPRAFKSFGQAKHEIARGKMGIIENAIGRFYYDCGRFPTEAEGLEALLVAPPDVQDKWGGEYLKKSEILDPWGNAYLYVQPGIVNPGSYDLISLGADGVEGGEGENADIVNE